MFFRGYPWKNIHVILSDRSEAEGVEESAAPFTTKKYVERNGSFDCAFGALRMT